MKKYEDFEGILISLLPPQKFAIRTWFCNFPQYLCLFRIVVECSPSTCEGVGDVVGVEAPLGGVAQVIFHGVQVVEVGLQVREHQDRGVEEDGEGQVEVEREVEENQRQQHMCDMRMT